MVFPESEDLIMVHIGANGAPLIIADSPEEALGAYLSYTKSMLPAEGIAISRCFEVLHKDRHPEIVEALNNGTLWEVAC